MNNMSERLTTLAEVCVKLSYIIFKVVWEKLLRFKSNLLLQFPEAKQNPQYPFPGI